MKCPLCGFEISSAEMTAFSNGERVHVTCLEDSDSYEL